MSGFVVLRKDGVPSYQRASLIDDLHFGINLIVRGEDLRDPTLAQLHLAALLSSETDVRGPMSGAASCTGALFSHHPLLRSLRGQKLLNSPGDIPVRHLRQEGLKPRQ